MNLKSKQLKMWNLNVCGGSKHHSQIILFCCSWSVICFQKWFPFWLVSVVRKKVVQYNQNCLMFLLNSIHIKNFKYKRFYNLEYQSICGFSSMLCNYFMNAKFGRRICYWCFTSECNKAIKALLVPTDFECSWYTAQRLA